MSTSSENMGKGTSSDIERKKKTILSSMALDYDKEKWISLQLKIEDCSLEEKRAMLKEYYSNSGIIDRSNELLLNLEKKCKDIINLLPDTIHNDMNDLLNIIVKRKN
jgi:geranylgeranyl pyrophosphate synthase